MRILWLIFFMALPMFSAPVVAYQEFAPADIIRWKPKHFLDSTHYTVEFDEQLQQPVIRAESNRSASGLFFQQRIDLDKTPYLSWSWKVGKFPTLDDERMKSGDDYAARIYVVVKDGWIPLDRKAINYIWSQQSPVGGIWPNPFAGERAMMWALQSGSADNGWVAEKRNLKEDLKQLFGKEFQYLDGVAIMTDSDNSRSSAVSYYSALKFTQQ